MKYVTQTLTLQSDEHYGKRVPPQAFGEILRTLPHLLRGSIRMSFEGRSTAKGSRPHWLKSASDVRFVDHDGDDDTVLYFEMPTLGESAEELYEQHELWDSRPDANDTAFDLLADVVEDVRTRASDSVRYDRPLLKNLHKMGRGLNGTFQSCLVSGQRYPKDSPATVDKEVVSSADELTRSTPQPQQVRVSGVLDMIRASTNSIGVKLETGEEVRGVLMDANAAQIHEMLNQRVTLMGKAIYRPSGNLLRVDVAELRAMQLEDSFFTKIPAPRIAAYGNESAVDSQRRASNIAAILGRWPGDETDDEIDRVLEELG